jgi:transposase
MDAKDYFLHPREPRQRHYEALRAVHAEGLSIRVAAERFGLSAAYLKKLSAEFQTALKRGEPYFFAPPPKGRKLGSAASPELVKQIVAMRKRNLSVPDIRAALNAQGHKISLWAIDRLLKREGFAPLPRRTREEREDVRLPARLPAPETAPLVWRDETFTTELGGGPLVFLPLLEHMGIVSAIERAGFPKTSVLSDRASVLSFLALKLLGNERLSHDAPYSLDRAMGLFAGLNVLPKSATLSSYSYRVQRKHNYTFLGELSRIFQGQSSLGEFNMDFKAIPHWGDESVLEKNWAGMRGKRIKSLLALLVQDPDTGLLAYSDAGIRHRNENGAVLEFVDFWKNERGQAPKMLIFDARFTTYENLDRLNKDGIKFLTLRRRGKNLIDAVEKLPQGQWQSIRIEGRRKHPDVRVHDSLISLRHYDGPIRQVVMTSHGRKHPAFLITNEHALPVAQVIPKYARRWLVEQEIAEQIDFFHLNTPSSGIVVKVDFDLTLSLLAHNLFRELTRQLPGFERCNVATIARDVLQNGAGVSIAGHHITVHLKKKVHLPALFELPWMRTPTPLSWMDASIAFDTATTS